MTVTNKEALSALVDDEASEIEVHRLVRDFKSVDSLAKTWFLYEEIRRVVRREDRALEEDKQRQLYDRIRQAVQLEGEYCAELDKRPSKIGILATSLAASACFVIAVVLGVQRLEEKDTLGIAGDISEPTEQAVAVAVAEETQTPELVELDEEKQRQLRTYLNQHDRMSRMDTYPKLVNFKDGNGK